MTKPWPQSTERIGAAGGGEVTRLEGLESGTWWAAYVAEQQALRRKARPGSLRRAPKRDGGFWPPGMTAALREIGIAMPYLAASPGLGAVVARLDFGSRRFVGACWPTRRRILLGLAETVTILAAPASWKHGIDVWGRLPDGI